MNEISIGNENNIIFYEDEEYAYLDPNAFSENDIILKPGEEKELEWIFPKFIDDQDASQAVILSSVRVMEKYSGTEDVPEEVIKSEIDNAIAKFSMEAVIVEK